MNIGVPSRFACLKIEDDDNRPQNAKQRDVKKKPDKPTASKKPNTKTDSTLKSKKETNIKQDVQKTTAKRKKNASFEQWEEWKLKDSEIVNGTYEQDLQNAIMLSKLDYEHNKQLHKKNEAVNGKVVNQNQNKKKKNKAMSINEFLKTNSDKPNHVQEVQVKPAKEVKVEHFFDEVKIATKEELNKEEILENRKKREVDIDKIVSLAQCQEKLEEEKTKRLTLQLELDKAKAEILTLNEKIKTLCSILGQGEMKDKADVLVELTEEVTRLHVLLEQERSKVAALTVDPHNNNKHKDKFQKRKQKGI